MSEMEFEGFEYKISGEDVAIDLKTAEVFDDGSGLTGDVSDEDNYFDDEMAKADEKINDILKKLNADN